MSPAWLQSLRDLTQSEEMLANDADTLSLYVKVIHPIKVGRVGMAVKTGTREQRL